MNRLQTSAALCVVSLLSLSAQAQRAMGGSMGGGVRAGGGVHATPAARPAAPARVAPARVAPARGVAVRRPVSNHVVITTGFPFRTPFRCFGVHCRNRFFFNNPFLFGAGFWGYPYYGYIPGFDNGSYSAPAQEPAAASENNGTDVQVAVALQRLSDEVGSVREEQIRQANAARSSGASISAHRPEGETTFVFRDGRRIVTQNYAIAGQTLWLLSEHAAKKVSLADLDLKATDQVNAANGVDLRIPDGN